jgi:hypothetical protein
VAGGDESQARANLRQALVRLKRSAGELLDESAGVMRVAAALFACVAVAPHTSELQRLAELCETLRVRCESGPPQARQSFHLSVGTCLNWWGRPVSAEVDLHQARLLANGFGDFGAVVNVTHQQLRNALLLGRTATALAAAEDCQRAVQTGGYGRSFVLHAWAAKVLVGVAALHRQIMQG